MTLATYDVGDTVRMAANFLSTADVPIDPTLVTIIYRDPVGFETTVTSNSTVMVHPSSGSYYIDHVVDQEGTWRWRSYSTGTLHTASEAVFVVRHQWVAVVSST